MFSSLECTYSRQHETLQTHPVPGEGFFSHLETQPLLHAELPSHPHKPLGYTNFHMLFPPEITQASGSDPTCPALSLTQGGQVQRGPFQGEALLLGVGIRSPLQFGVRDAGVLLDLHGGALQQQHSVPKSLSLTTTQTCPQQFHSVRMKPPEPLLLMHLAQKPKSEPDGPGSQLVPREHQATVPLRSSNFSSAERQARLPGPLLRTTAGGWRS